jgi:hypothetical protein
MVFLSNFLQYTEVTTTAVEYLEAIQIVEVLKSINNGAETQKNIFGQV